MELRSTDVRGRAEEAGERPSADPRRREAEGPPRERMFSIETVPVRPARPAVAGLGKRGRRGAGSIVGRAELRLDVGCERAPDSPPGTALRTGEGFDRGVGVPRLDEELDEERDEDEGRKRVVLDGDEPVLGRELVLGRLGAGAE